MRLDTTAPDTLYSVPDPSFVSIVVPAYNAARYLRQSLDSIAAQTYPHREILLMDDASSDNTGEIARSYGDRIAYIRQPRNLGQFANVNDGIARARGDYIAVYHADDIYLPRMAAIQAAFLDAHPQAGAVFASEIFIDAEGRERGRLQLPPGIQSGALLDYATVLNTLLKYKNRILPGPGSMVRAAAYRIAGPYRGVEYPVAGDFEMFLRISRRFPVAILAEYLFYYRWGHGNADQMDRRLRTAVEPYFKIMDEHLASGARALARPEALAAHRAHFAEDALMRSVNAYVMKRRPEMAAALEDASLPALLGSGYIQRYRLSALYLLLSILLRIPHVDTAERLFRRRWSSRF